MEPGATSNVEYDVYEDDDNWDFALITLNIGKLELSLKLKGVHEGHYRPTLTKFQNHQFVSLLLINVFSFLSHDPKGNLFNNSIQNAKRDKEWLIFPMTPVEFDNGIIEYSAILDGGCLDIQNIEYDTISQVN